MDFSVYDEGISQKEKDQKKPGCEFISTQYETLLTMTSAPTGDRKEQYEFPGSRQISLYGEIKVDYGQTRSSVSVFVQYCIWAASGETSYVIWISQFINSLYIVR